MTRSGFEPDSRRRGWIGPALVGVALIVVLGLLALAAARVYGA